MHFLVNLFTETDPQLILFFLPVNWSYIAIIATKLNVELGKKQFVVQTVSTDHLHHYKYTLQPPNLPFVFQWSIILKEKSKYFQPANLKLHTHQNQLHKPEHNFLCWRLDAIDFIYQSQNNRFKHRTFFSTCIFKITYTPKPTPQTRTQIFVFTIYILYTKAKTIN